ncbi:reverse transcriptase domain-containing protein [Tanacetum coccineum]
MTTPVEKRNNRKFCEFHGEVGNNTDECMHLKRQIKELLKAGKLLQRVARQRITQSFSPNQKISSPPLGEEEGTEGPMIIEAEIGDHFIHRICVRLEACGHDWRLKAYSGTSVKCAGRMSSGQTKKREVKQRIETRQYKKKLKKSLMKEVHYHSWLSNPVMVKKHDGSWRMCVDFKDLNKACPKDGYPLPKIDWKVESLCGFPFKYFLDAYKGYHQIKMAKEDEEKTAFITSQEIFCYSKMPFGLRNAGATYQRLVDKAFHKHIGRNLECTFGVEEGVFLGYKVNTKGIKVCPDKADAILSLPSPKCLKDVQKLNGKLASLNRFLAKSAEKSLPFFKTLKKCTKKSDFHWTEEAEFAFKEMKQLIAKLPMLIAPKEKEELIIYLAAVKEAVNFIVERPEEDPPDTPIEIEEELPEPWMLFEATNNEAEYEALIAGLRIAEQMGVKNLQANVDSLLVANHVNGTYEAKEADMIRYLEKMRTLSNGFRMFLIKQIPRSENKKADAVSKQVLVEELKEKSINEVEVLAVVEEEGDTWMTPRQGQCDASHSGSQWSMGSSTRNLFSDHGYEGPGKSKFLIVAIDYFTKWIEARPVATITGNQVKKFVWDNIVCRFGLLGEIISDNGKQFRDNPFKDWCEKLCIRQRFASVKHPQANGLLERANRSLGEGIKARLNARSKN